MPITCTANFLNFLAGSSGLHLLILQLPLLLCRTTRKALSVAADFDFYERQRRSHVSWPFIGG